MSLFDYTPNNVIVHAVALASDFSDVCDSVVINKQTLPPEIEDRKKLIEWYTPDEVARAILWQHKDYTVLAPTGIGKENDPSMYKLAAEEFIKMMYWTYAWP